MLRWLYTEGWVERGEDASTNWRLHLDVAIVGNKYGVACLEHLAFAAFRASARNLTDTREIMDLLRTLPDYLDRLDGLEDFHKTLRAQYLVQLPLEREPDLLGELDERDRGCVMWWYIDQLAVGYEWLFESGYLHRDTVATALRIAGERAAGR